MKTKHTPGPWEMRVWGGSISIDTEGGAHAGIAFVAPNASKTVLPTAQNKANARLIAAAPRLLAACEYVVNWHREHDSGEGELFGLDFVTACISALRQADPDWHTTITPPQRAATGHRHD